MRIFFDCRMITHPGIGRYIKELLFYLLQFKNLEVVCLGEKKYISKILKVSSSRMIEFDYPIYSLQEQIGFLKLRRIIKEGILHIPHYNIPVFCKCKLVVTIHDVIHLLYPQSAKSRMAPFYMRVMIDNIFRKASKIVCVSNTTKNYLAQQFPYYFNKFSYKIEVIYEGISSNFRKIENSNVLRQVKDKYNLPDKFILYVGSIRKHKNISALIKAVGELTKILPFIKLVLVGRESFFKIKFPEYVRYLGEVNDEDLAVIYNLSSVFCSLSLCEGFGFPVLEAQKCGVPVVCSDIPVFNEILKDTAIFVNPTQVDHIKEALYNVLKNEELRRTLIKKGLENASGFRWDITANKTAKLYYEIS